MIRLFLAVLFCLLAVPVYGQAVKNPTVLTFASIDHAVGAVVGYEIDIVRADNTVAQTIVVTKANTTVNTAGNVQVAINVQPVAFGNYTFVARTIAGTTKSANSPPSDVWERAPGAPSKPVAQ